jgi:hypothetical protein
MARKTSTRSRRTSTSTRQIESDAAKRRSLERCLQGVCNAENAGELFEALKLLKRGMDGIYAPREVIKIREREGTATVWIMSISTEPSSRIATLMFDLTHGGTRKSYDMICGTGRAELRRIRNPARLIGMLRECAADGNRSLSARHSHGIALFNFLGELA